MKEFYVLGSSLNEYTSFDGRTQDIISQADLILGERFKVTQARLKKTPVKPSCQIFYLDNLNGPNQKLLQNQFEELSKKNSRICLFSDMGMPLLFDPGKEWLELALRLGFNLRCEAGPTSWGTACALSLWNPPFWVQGFLSQKSEERLQQLERLRSISAHIVLMDTPYRFQTLLKACDEVFGPRHSAFLAWEISSSKERYFWGSLGQIQKTVLSAGLTKGEFILLLKNPSLVN